MKRYKTSSEGWKVDYARNKGSMTLTSLHVQSPTDPDDDSYRAIWVSLRDKGTISVRVMHSTIKGETYYNRQAVFDTPAQFMTWMRLEQQKENMDDLLMAVFAMLWGLDPDKVPTRH